MYDVIIIGGGIIGVTTAKILSKYRLEVAVIERERDLGEGASKSNSGVLASGFHPRAGSLKGTSCVKGNEMYHEICEKLDVPVKFIGSLMLAYSQDGIEKIEEKYKKGLANGVPGMKFMDPEQVFEMEPAVSSNIVKALYSPTTGIVDVFKLLYHSAELAAINGVEFKRGTEVEKIEANREGYRVITDKGEFKSRFIVNAAGENADKMEDFIEPCRFEIEPRRGQFFVFEKEEEPLIKHVIYQMQETDEKGIFITPTMGGNLIAGPTSENVPDYRYKETTEEGLKKVTRVAKKIIPSLDMSKVITSFAGLRANISNVDKSEKDFVINRTKKGMVSALGIKNPGITSAPVLAELIVEKLVEDGLKLEEKDFYHDRFKADKKFFDCSLKEKEELLKEDSDYGRVVCRCEKVTLGDIKKSLNGPIPPVNIDGLKRRLHIGMGKCQGGFCTPELIEILSKRWNVPPEKILKSGTGSQIVKGFLK